MTRPIRVELEGAVYHVMASGNERRAIFRSVRDHALFLETLGEVERSDFKFQELTPFASSLLFLSAEFRPDCR